MSKTPTKASSPAEVETDGGATKEIECRPMIAPVAPGDDAG